MTAEIKKITKCLELLASFPEFTDKEKDQMANFIMIRYNPESDKLSNTPILVIRNPGKGFLDLFVDNKYEEYNILSCRFIDGSKSYLEKQSKRTIVIYSVIHKPSSEKQYIILFTEGRKPITWSELVEYYFSNIYNSGQSSQPVLFAADPGEFKVQAIEEISGQFYLKKFEE